MKKILIYTAIYALAFTVSISAGYVNAKEKDSNLIYIDSNVQFPPTPWGIFRHTFRLRIPQNSKAVTQLIIKVPNDVTVSKDVRNIDVLDKNEHQINTHISINGKIILLVFSEPLAPNTKFDIDLNKIKRRNLGNGSVYIFSAKEVGVNAEIPIGVAYFRLY